MKTVSEEGEVSPIPTVIRRLRYCLAIVLFWALATPQPGLASDPQNPAPVEEDCRVVNAWCLDLVDAPAELDGGDQPVRIALVDSGVWANDPRFPARSIQEGHNYVLESAITNDLIGHGSRTAAIILGGSCEDGELAGLGAHASLVPLVWITKYPSGVEANGGIHGLSSAIRDAVDIHGCRIINVGSGTRVDDPELQAAVTYAEEKGAIVIAAAGNTNLSTPDDVFYPAYYPTVISAGSVGKDMLVSGFSQRNPGVTVVAPGEGVPSFARGSNSGFEEVSGTSYSAAYVSGFAALTLSLYPDTTPAQFREILKESSSDLGEPGYDTSYGYGLIDVSRGLSLARDRHAITRGEFVATLSRLSGETHPPAGGAFADVDPADPSAPAIAWAARAGIALGYEGQFRPDEKITREDMAVMLVRFAEHCGSRNPEAAELALRDAALVDGYALLSVARITAAGIMGVGLSGDFRPLDTVTGAQAEEACESMLRVARGVTSPSPLTPRATP